MVVDNPQMMRMRCRNELCAASQVGRTKLLDHRSCGTRTDALGNTSMLDRQGIVQSLWLSVVAATEKLFQRTQVLPECCPRQVPKSATRKKLNYECTRTEENPQNQDPPMLKEKVHLHSIKITTKITSARKKRENEARGTKEE